MPPKYYTDLSSPELVKLAMVMERDSTLSARGALMVRSYEKMGRSPADKRVVDTPDVSKNVDWGDVNIKLSEDSFQKVKARAIEFLNKQDTLFVVNAFAGHDPRYQLKIRVVTTRPYHALFMRNMLIVPTAEQLKTFGEPDYTIYNAGECWADPTVPGVKSKTCVAVNFRSREQVILGTQYAGEMKKGVLTIMFELMPRQGHLTMHASANVGKKGDVTVFFGLSGTGKTTLSADPHRALIGDDEHVWTDTGVFNIEGGCYAKAIGLNPKTEFDIWNAVRFGAVAENCVQLPNKEIDFDDESICKNTRVAYPLNYIDGALTKAVAGHPTNIVFLTNDAFGVMPPVAQLTPEQAMFWFVTGYTAKVPGIEADGSMKVPGATFSPCFGGPFLVRHPTFYGEQLAAKMRQHNARVWLVNTGYAGGRVDRGAKRMPLRVTRAVLDGIHSGALANCEFETLPGWGLRIPKAIPGVPQALVSPVNSWSDKALFFETTNMVIDLFRKNFEKKFAAAASQEMRSAVPQLLPANSKL